jgi:adenylate cyclase
VKLSLEYKSIQMLAAETLTALPRRLAVLAFADIVGWSVLAAADEAEAAARWMAMFRGIVAPACERLGGRIVDVLGDGTLAEFPEVPAALDWAEALHVAAAEAAEARPDALPITFRIAIHLGTVMVEGARILGDAVNLAARLQEYGTPGGTLLSAEAAANAPEARIAGARELGALPLRNLSRAVRAVSLDPARRVPVPVAPPATALPTVAVLPLENLGGGVEDDYLAAGVVEDVAASLAGLHEVFVIAPESARMFIGQSPQPQRVGRVLGVRFAVMGGFHRSGGGFRVSVRLVDTASGEQLWGERIEAAEREVFAVQEHVVARVVAGVAPNIRAAALREAMRKRPESLSAYDHMLRGLHCMGSQDNAAFACARDHFALAVAADPGFALPLAWSARWHSINIGMGWSADRAHDTRETFALAERALALDPSNALALSVLGHVTAFLRRDCDAAIEMFDQALAISPGTAIAWTLSSATLSYLGRGEEAVARVARGMQLSPYDPLRFTQLHFAGIAAYVAGDLERAESFSRKAIGANASHASSWRTMTAVLGALGRSDEAIAAGRRMLSLDPGFRLGAYVRDTMPYCHPQTRARFERDLRVACVPD